MPHLDDKEYRNIKAFIKVLTELEDLVIEGCREALCTDANGSTSASLTIERNLCDLEDSRQAFYNSNYAMSDMLQYLDNIVNGKIIWQSAMIAMLKSYSSASSSSAVTWRFLLTQILTVGARAWRLFVPCTKTITGGALTLNAVIERFALLDDMLDQLLPALGMWKLRGERFSDELRDTLHALTAIRQAVNNSPYQPPLTMERIDAMKSEIRQRRRTQAVVNISPKEQPVDGPSSSPLPPDSPLRTWSPTITATVTIITLLSAILGYPAWQNSKHSPGTRHDADFWFLVQASVMQMLGVLTIVFPLVSGARLARQPLFWTWGLVVTSLACSVIAIPFYLVFPTEWSQTLVFFGSAAQVFVILQAIFTVDAAHSSRSGATKSK